ncbi:MAG: HEPN domain-containing protein [Patescibacteria group bacterium]
MIAKEIKKIAKNRLKDAETLLRAKRYDGAVYICGYAIELCLKKQICKKLQWTEFPPGHNFNDYKSLKTHNLEILLSFTGKESKVKKQLFAEWSIVSQWDPESRYNPIGNIKNKEAKQMINSAKKILKEL